MIRNILYLHSHDTGRYIQPYGYAVHTPNLQKLAEESVLFRQAFCAAPVCSPSRAALLTGQAPHSNGMIGLAHIGFQLNDFSQTLVHFLKRNGMTTILAGTQHIAARDELIGYDRILDPRTSYVPRRARLVAPVVEDFMKSKPKHPFFLDVGFFETHRPFPELHPEEDARYCLPPATMVDTQATLQDMAAYQRSARDLDVGIGRVLAALEEAGLADETLVICTTDHGIAFPGMKATLTDNGLGVMLMLRGPADLSGGRVMEAMVSQIDLFPTVCEILQLPKPEWLQGQSLWPILRGEVKEVHQGIFAEMTYHSAYEPQRAIRTQRYKYIRRFGERVMPVLPNIDDGPSKDVWLEHNYAEESLEPEQLYDLVLDPKEMRNLAKEPRMTNTLNELRTRLHQWMVATQDQLLEGQVAAPEGAQVCSVDWISSVPPRPTSPLSPRGSNAISSQN